MATACLDGETHDSAHTEADARAAGLPCGGRGEPLQGLQAVDSVDGGRVAHLALIAAEPPRPIVGNNTWSFTLRVDEEPLEGAASATTVTPFMPDHGHGTPTEVVVTEIEPGVYRFAPVHTRMAGYWEIGVDVSTERMHAHFEFGVCVE
jgi:YtkA-like